MPASHLFKEELMSTRATQARAQSEEHPAPKSVRGKCPECGGDLVSKCYYVKGKGYLIVWECWESLRDEPTCAYRRVL